MIDKKFEATMNEIEENFPFEPEADESFVVVLDFRRQSVFVDWKIFSRRREFGFVSSTRLVLRSTETNLREKFVEKSEKIVSSKMTRSIVFFSSEREFSAKMSSSRRSFSCRNEKQNFSSTNEKVRVKSDRLSIEFVFLKFRCFSRVRCNVLRTIFVFLSR